MAVQRTARFTWQPAIRAALEGAAVLHELPPALVRAVAYVESRGNPLAVSPAGARGLMQIMPKTGDSLGLQDPFDPVENARAGAQYLSMMIAQFGSVEHALHAYNWGPGNLARAVRGEAKIPESVKKYARDVLARMEVERSSAPFLPTPSTAAPSCSALLCCPACGSSLSLAAVVAEKR